MIHIEHEEENGKGRWIALSYGDEAGEMTYSVAGDDKIIIDHTFVSDTFKGQGIGAKLLEAAVAYVKAHGLKIIPLCPYVKSRFDKDTELQSLLY
jgi:predicted GNAT family acetyltransferase